MFVLWKSVIIPRTGMEGERSQEDERFLSVITNRTIDTSSTRLSFSYCRSCYGCTAGGIHTADYRRRSRDNSKVCFCCEKHTVVLRGSSACVSHHPGNHA